MSAMENLAAGSAGARVMARCDELAAISESADGLTRVYLSTEHQRANALVGEWMQAAGMRVWQDAVGNICGRYEGQSAGAQALLLGSHLDTVRNAGRYDGMLGVVAAIETVQHFHDCGMRLPLAIEIVGFADEEGTRFGITLLGSRGLTGSWPEGWVDQADANGVTVAQAMAAVGLDAADIPGAARKNSDFAAYLELHIEQGPCLEREQLALGVVTAINGARRLNCRFVGLAGHAGTVPMSHRKDALAAAAQWMVYIEAQTAQRDPQLVATVGSLQCHPGAVNVIPGEVALTLDVRGPEDQALADLLDDLLSQGEAIARQRGLAFHASQYYGIPATRCDDAMQASLAHVLTRVQGRSLSLPSGAGHDAIAMAERWPVGMLFVRCEGGVSHHPAEAVEVDDVALAIQACVDWVEVLALEPPQAKPAA
ncbi:allantoate amidohydrolase [Pseudomonas daroniae]|uniref:Allantoate amidohydrolase n=1 Tax=Phytopseudomonas daroniae TaxID=2487519 RepID=A0A4Q9QGT4_9GAMM|nr:MULTISPECIES: allantoate amidohydrolase [Pseudomonas]TBU73459.1 allantoate amidohydrolase [Pseudomonas daroniae]TBU79211.1 allantoate amidohydrolase [Pseudomonas sp. FRB 228]TBU88109.1 allantoate amidohydrolase [Pseudomonas daroniae]